MTKAYANKFLVYLYVNGYLKKEIYQFDPFPIN
jgi:hypothetical protein